MTAAVTDDESAPPPPAVRSVAPSWSLIPKDSDDNMLFTAGLSFRLLFVTSTERTAQSSDIADYNTFVQNAADTNAALKPFKGKFRPLISTGAVHARDNTGTTRTGVPIYWLGGEKVADGYADFYDGSWDSEVGKTESGGTVCMDNEVLTGSNADGTKHGHAVGNSSRLVGTGYVYTASFSPSLTGVFKVC